MTISSEIKNIKGVGEKIEKKFQKLNIITIKDFLFSFPFRFENYGKLKKIKDLVYKEKCVFLARVELLDSKRSVLKRRNFTKAIVRDDTGKIEVVWFNNPWVKNSLVSGELYYFIGETSLSGINNIEIVNPLFRKYKKDDKAFDNEIIFPIYRTTSGLKQQVFRNIASKIFLEEQKIEDYIPKYIKDKYDYFDIGKAIKNVHLPKDLDSLNKSISRLKFDELFLYQLLNQLRKERNSKRKATKIKFFEKETKEFTKSFGFELTEKQKKVAWEILLDLEKEKPTNRLLEGDVGSGKTVVFLIAVLNVILNNKTAAIMAPTSILANQHYKKVCDLFLDKDFINKKLNILLLTSANVLLNNEKIKKQDALKLISEEKIDIIIGTHAVISDDVEIKNLGLVVVDEQHRFGVNQRKKIKNIKKEDKNKIYPHFLSVTATPIPRTLALAFYGDLSISILDEKPKNRKDILTKIENDFDVIYKKVREEIDTGRQVYIICPLIEQEITDEENIFESEIKSAKKTFENISKMKIFEGYNIGLLHGKLKQNEKDKIEKEFHDGKINILVSTSVVEVGIDVPNATCIAILGADKFGLAQLYQLRGRVGRSDLESFCFLQTSSSNPKTINRLNEIIKAKNSFELAEADARERGCGNLYGLQQSGHVPELKVATLFDYEIIKRAKEEAENIIENNLEFKDLDLLKKEVTEKELNIHFE